MTLALCIGGYALWIVVTLFGPYVLRGYDPESKLLDLPFDPSGSIDSFYLVCICFAPPFGLLLGGIALLFEGASFVFSSAPKLAERFGQRLAQRRLPEARALDENSER